MIKRISLVARKPDLTIEEFERHWSGPHVDIIRQIPTLRGLRLNLIRGTDGLREWDGIGELWFDSLDEGRQAFTSEPIRSLLAADRPKFVGRLEVYWVDEDTLVPPPASHSRNGVM